MHQTNNPAIAAACDAVGEECALTPHDLARKDIQQTLYGEAAPAARPAPFHPSASHIHPEYRDGWNAALAAAQAAPVAQLSEPPEGWKLVPGNPTKDDLVSCREADLLVHSNIDIHGVWRDILAAAQPVGWLYKGTAPHTQGRLVFHKDRAANLETRWWVELGQVYLAPQSAAAAQPVEVQRVGLTDAEIEALIKANHFSEKYRLKESDRTVLAWYRIGVRDGERVHGIQPAGEKGGA